MKKTNPILKFIINLLIFAAFIAGIHFLVYAVLPNSQKPDGIIEMHIFLLLLTVFTHVALMFLLKKKTEYMGYGFIGASFLKMIICVLFLLPEIMNQTATTNSYVFQFFGLYFAYLTFEVVLLAKALKKNEVPKVIS
jgi:hypothetical protein